MNEWFCLAAYVNIPYFLYPIKGKNNQHTSAFPLHIGNGRYTDTVSSAMFVRSSCLYMYRTVIVCQTSFVATYDISQCLSVQLASYIADSVKAS